MDMTGRRLLYPELAPFDGGVLGLDGLHKMAFEQSGNPAGVPALFLHGGPGAGAQPVHRRFFDPAFYRIIAFDQRGCGRSRPLGELRANTTADLIADIERLRRHLGIERWLLFGGSWGSTLALAYAQAHPARCLGLVLRGVFLGEQPEIDWFLHGMRTVFPEAWRAFAEHLPEAERADLLFAYHKRLTDPDPGVHGPAAEAWCRYEAACSHLLPAGDPTRPMPLGQGVVALARIEAHYMRHRCFLGDGQLLAGVDAVRHLPCVIVQGRYDMVCPPLTAHRLAQSWPEARLVMIPDAGHSALEPGIRAALVDATEDMKSLIGPNRA